MVMGWFWNISLLLLALGCSSCSNTSYVNNILRNLVSQHGTNLIKCLSYIIRGYNGTLSTRIHAKAQEETFTQTFRDTVDLLCASVEGTPVEFSKGENKNYNIKLRLFFVDSITSLRSYKWHGELDKKLSIKRRFFLIVLPMYNRDTLATLNQIFNMYFKKSFLNVNVLIEGSDGVVTLFTFFPFTEHSCNDTTPVILNQFTNGSFQREGLIFPSKTKQLWQCPIAAILWNEVPLVRLDHQPPSGLDGFVLGNLSKIMNFSVNVIRSPYGRGHYYSKNDSNGGFKMLSNTEGDLIIGGCACTKERHQAFAPVTYRVANMVIIFKQPQERSSLEILLFPFDSRTWFAILIAELATWFGRLLWSRIGHRMPRYETSYRVRSISYLFAILVLRSSYEGSIFKFLHNRPVQHLPSSLEEAINQDYRFFIWSSGYDFLKSIPELRIKMTRLNGSVVDSFKFFDRSKGKFGLIVYEEYLSLYNNDSEKCKSYVIARKPILSAPQCIYLPKSSYLAVQMVYRTQQIIEHGHVHRIRKTSAQIYNFRKKASFNSNPDTTSLPQLRGTFQLYAMLALLGICVFLLEIMSKYKNLPQWTFCTSSFKSSQAK